MGTENPSFGESSPETMWRHEKTRGDNLGWWSLYWGQVGRKVSDYGKHRVCIKGHHVPLGYICVPLGLVTAISPTLELRGALNQIIEHSSRQKQDLSRDS